MIVEFRGRDILRGSQVVIQEAREQVDLLPGLGHRSLGNFIRRSHGVFLVYRTKAELLPYSVPLAAWFEISAGIRVVFGGSAPPNKVRFWFFSNRRIL